MTNQFKALAILALAPACAAAYAQSAASSPTTPVHHHRKPVERKPSVESQIEELKGQMDSQKGEIDTLKQQLSDRDAQLQQAQQAAAAAQQAAQAAQAAANQEQQTLSANSEAVTSLQTSVSDLKSSNSALTTSVHHDIEEAKRSIEHPDAINYKGITLSPAGSFIEAATVWRSAATGGGINTPFTSVPLANADDANISEFFGSGRQSRLALKANAKLDNVDITGYYEMDWLGTGVTSNNNQSNSYVMRMRQLWARAAFNSGWNISAGQMWSLATETTHGLDNGTEILPSTIDPQYSAGFVWTRQYGFRVTKDFGNKVWFGASAENAETLNPGGTIGATTTPIDMGTNGVGGGLYNLDANYSFNEAPDLVAKVAFEPGWGHWELFGVSRFFRDRIYPNDVCTTSGTTTTCNGDTAGAYNDTEVGGGVGGGFRAPLAGKRITIGLKGLYGDGTGRYGSSTISDITIKPNGQISPLHSFSALSTVEVNPTKRLNIYLNYGGDYVGRDIQGKNGYGLYSVNMSGCNAEPAPGSTNATNGGYGFSPSNPANCGGNNKDVQEFTSGYWYNFYAGPKGRFRMGLQYSWFERNLWSGQGGTTNPGGNAHGNDNIVETSMRYYLP